VKNLKKVLEVSQDRFALKQEAVKDYSLFAADLNETEFKEEGEAAGIYQYLKSTSDEDSATQSLKYMGKVLFKNGQRKRAINIYDYLISVNPMHVRKRTHRKIFMAT
jgi:tetratricopeptide (TPR) repeat protein